MTLYQGKALRAAPAARPRPSTGRLGRMLHVVAAIAVVVALAHVPWASLSGRLATVGEVRVTGLRYLDAEAVRRAAGLEKGQNLFAVDLARARQKLLLHPRIARADVRRRWPRGIEVRITERAPVLLVRHGAPWELDRTGMLLEPLGKGAVADAPLLAGADVGDLPAGTRVATPEVRRGLAWVEALGDRELQLVGRVSEIDVSHHDATALTLMDGTRVQAPAWPPGVRALSALRVVLADLAQRGVAARELDLRFKDQVIVRPLDPVQALAASGPGGPGP